MKFAIGITCDKEVNEKIELINELKGKINAFLNTQDYGNGILDYFISLSIVNPPKGFEHLFPILKPKFTEYKERINKHTGEKYEIVKQFHYGIKIDGENFERFVNANKTESQTIIALEILNSLSNLDTLPKKVKDFDKKRFKEDMKRFFKEQNLI